MAYLGNSPLNRLFNIQAITLSQGQVNVNVAYTPGMVLFFKNGALLIPNTDYTATNGSVLTLAKAANAGDVIQGINLASYAVADAVPLSGGTVGGLLTGPASATESVAGLVKLATAAVAQGFTNEKDVLTAKTLADAFKGGNQGLTANGYQKLPGGLILQWGTQSGFGGYTVTLPIAFPTGFLCSPIVTAEGSPDGATEGAAAWAESALVIGSKTTFKIWCYRPNISGGAIGTARQVNWLAIGF